MRKSQTTTTNIVFTFTFFIQKRIYLVIKHIWKTQPILLHLYCTFFMWQVMALFSHVNAVITQQRPYRYVLVLQRPYFNPKYLATDQVIQRSTVNLEKKKKYLSGKIFGSLHTSNWIYFLWNCFSNYVYLNDMYITLKRIEKILFVLVLRILLNCKFLNFTAVFAYNFS